MFGWAFVIVLLCACLLSGSVKYWSLIVEKKLGCILYSKLTKIGEGSRGDILQQFFFSHLVLISMLRQP